MSTYIYECRGTFPNLNDYLKAERQRFGKGKRVETGGNIMKKNAEGKIGKSIIHYLKGAKIKTPIIIHYHFYEPNKMRDMDNIASFFMKCNQDALSRNGIIEDDGWKHISGFTCEFSVDKANPRIVVELEEV